MMHSSEHFTQAFVIMVATPLTVCFQVATQAGKAALQQFCDSEEHQGVEDTPNGDLVSNNQGYVAIGGQLKG